MPQRVTSRGAVRAANLRHRATYVVVTVRAASSTGSLVLAHQRAAWKDIWPSRWDLAFGGICNAGESFLDAAERELTEEAGVRANPAQFVPLGPIRFESRETRVVGQVYRLEHRGPFTFPDGEVVAHCWVPLAGLGAFASMHELCADTEAVVLPLLTQR